MEQRKPGLRRVIGIFDSGHGGLTVMRALVERLPRQGFIYLGDHADAPYGGRPPAEILDLTRAGVETLFGLGCRLVILACNTAAAVALRPLQQQWLPVRHPDQRVLGVLVPMVEAIARTPWHADSRLADPTRMPETVGIFATPATVASGAYVREVAKRAPAVRVVQRACPELAGLIERGAPDTVIGSAVATHVAALLEQLGHEQLDSVVLGCTHYPLIEPAFRAALPPQAVIMSQPDRVAASLTAYLWRHPEYRDFGLLPAPLRFLTTGDPTLVSGLASRFFGATETFAPVRG